MENKQKLKTKVRDIIYDYVYTYFGESEAQDPSWNIELLANDIAEKLLDKIYTPQYQYKNINDIDEGE